MSKLKILIVDDVDVNRLILSEICKKLDNVILEEAEDGLEAVEIALQWKPDIILMDIVMPNLNGIDAVKLIKKEHADAIIFIISSTVDDFIQEQVSNLGVQAFLHRPFDPNIILFKIMSFALGMQNGQNSISSLSLNNAVNIFNKKVRHFKTLFSIENTESMMDFGTWMIARCSENGISANKLDSLLEFFYQFLDFELHDLGPFTVVIEESFDELYISFEFQYPIQINHPMFLKLAGFFPESQSVDKSLYIRIPISFCKKELPEKFASDGNIRIVEGEEKELLRQSFIEKISAWDYVNALGNDTIAEIQNMGHLDHVWTDNIGMLKQEPTVERLSGFVDNVLEKYIHTINSLDEFTALAYALSSLSMSIKENSVKITEDSAVLEKMIMMLEYLRNDLSKWREHIFELRDTADIHYLDSSFFSSCIQIEGMISDKTIVTDDDGFELF